jgi:hypothetical protein
MRLSHNVRKNLKREEEMMEDNNSGVNNEGFVTNTTRGVN